MTDTWRVDYRTQRLQLREAFVLRATELFDDQHQRIGIPALGAGLLFWSHLSHQGIVTLNGFLADGTSTFAGYVAGQPNGASRDQARPPASQDRILPWIRGRELRMRAVGRCTDSVQLELAYTRKHALNPSSADSASESTGPGVTGFRQRVHQ